MRVVLAAVVLFGACFEKDAATPCTLTCHTASCPDDLVCGSDFVCHSPGTPICANPPNAPTFVVAPNAGTGDLFGASIAVSADGSWLVVGAPGEASGGAQSDDSLPGAGAVYTYEWDGGAYVLRDYLKHPFPDAGDRFGASVGISANGNVLAIGAPFDDSFGTNLDADPSDDSSSDVAAVFVYDRTGPGAPWQRRNFIKPAMAFASTQFGASVSLSSDGRSVAIGVPGTMQAVKAHPFDEPYAAEVVPLGGAVGDRVGGSIAISRDGTTMLLGAENEDGPGTGFTGDPTLNSATDAGAAIVVEFPSAETRYCKASNTDAGDHFGSSVAVDEHGDSYAVGARDEDSAAVDNNGDQTDNTASDAGAVYMFDRTGTASWAPTTYLKAPDTAAGAGFGRSVALTADGTLLVVGAPGAGAVYTFDKVPSGWQLAAAHRPSANDAGDELGASAAVSDDHAVVVAGAPRSDNSAEDAGAVYFFR